MAVDPLAWSYTRDANGNPTRIEAQGIGLYGNRTFTYDPANRLTATCFVLTASCPSVSSQAWTYDVVGRRLTQNDAGISTTYTYDVADQMLTSKLGTVTSGYSYDGNGNQLTGGTRVSMYNAAKQTVSVKDGTAPVTTYVYDGKGNRVPWPMHSRPCLKWLLSGDE